MVIACARICTSLRRPCFFANFSDTISAAAAPQVGGQAIRRVITPGHITLSFITSSVLSTFLKIASGLAAACRLALARMAAKVCIFVPYFCMCSRPAPPKVRRACGRSGTSAVRSLTMCETRARVRGRSSQCDLSAPACICSKPSANTQSASPSATAWRAR
ncbi:hypothetical protein D3C85_1053120 [compost metagenome]